MDSNDEKKKMRPALKLTIVFVCVVAFLTFYSNTMYNANIPTVHVTGVKSEKIKLEYEGEGLIVPKETIPVFAPGDLVVKEVFVRQYDKVEEWDVLATFDVSGLENQLKDLESSRKQKITQLHIEWSPVLEMEIGDTERHIRILREQILNVREMTAPFSGTVIGIFAHPGMMVGRSAPVFELSDALQGFVIKHIMPEENAKYFERGDVFPLGSIHKIRGNVIERRPAPGGGVEITIELDPGKVPLRPDILATFVLTHITEKLPALVPTTSIIDGMFVYKLIETDGPLGTEYRAQRIEVKVDFISEGWAAVTGDIRKGDRVVVSSDRPLSDERVKVYQE